MRMPALSSIAITAVLSSAVLTSACSHINVNQMAYEALRKEDCRINALDDFCTRNFAREYHEYERIRRDYLRSQTQTAWRVSEDETILEVSVEDETVIQ